MKWIDNKLGPFSVRVWGLIFNFIGNALALYGAVCIFKNNGGWPHLIVGIFLTIVCISFLAIPSQDNDD